MKLRVMVKVLILLVIIGGIAVYVGALNGVNIQQLVGTALKGQRVPDISRSAGLIPDVLRLPSESKTVYKWRDEQGVWNFSVKKPPGINVEIIELIPGEGSNVEDVLPSTVEVD